MQAKPRRPRRRKSRSNSSWLLMAVIWLPVALVLPRLLQNNVSSPPDRLEDRSNSAADNSLRDNPLPNRVSPLASRPPSFEDALQAVTALAQQADSINQTRNGISQAQYDRWRQSQGQPRQAIANLQPAEVEAIYRAYWQQGNCGIYAAPLDVACLDTMLSFGVADGRWFFAGLPPDPQQAAIEVAQRRIEYRQRQQNSPFASSTGETAANPQSAPQLLAAGIARDRALQAFLSGDSTGQNSSRIAARPPGTPAAAGSGNVSIGDRPPAPGASITESPPDSPPSLWTRLGDLLPEWMRRQEAENPAIELDARTLYANAKPFTVEVWIHVNSGYAPATGIIVRSDGLILTNYHVISENPTPSIQLADGRKFEGRIVTSDRSIDLALLQIQGAAGLPTANLADSTRDVRAGDTVYAIGSPMGSHWKLSRAQVMNTSSLCGSRALDNRCIRTPGGFLFPGNSGGPLLNTRGEVIGVNRAIQESTGQGVSIPIEIVQQFLARSSDREAVQQP